MKTPDCGSLVEEVRALEKSQENQRRLGLWRPSRNTAEAYWHGRPKDGLSFIPFTIELEHEMWGKVRDFDLGKYYTDGETYLRADLDMKVCRFRSFADGTPVGRIVPIWMGAGFEAALFGMPQGYTHDRDPWLGREPVLKEKSDLDRLVAPDFYGNPAMEVAHRMLRDMRAILPEDFAVVMHDWCRGPFGLACHLRGMEKIVVDMEDDPGFVHALMRFLNDARKAWSIKRAQFMGVPLQPSSLYNDEVNVPLLSPRLYESFVLPYEIELSLFYGGITYWHSCGNIAPLQPLIKTIPRLEMMHVSPWTSLEQSVAELRGSEIALEVVLHPFSDVHAATAKQMTSRLTRIRETAQGMPVTVRADGLQVLTSADRDMAKICEWAGIANRILGAGAPATQGPAANGR